ncbi:hypothetical protein KCP76_21355 [Salmonella enterica subsp. enterica serovar Weltevreden]|nr:hypothetical protein KCP76_21355 [Salmonella enterica subsp. enterica serovar Weltevreden]
MMEASRCTAAAEQKRSKGLPYCGQNRDGEKLAMMVKYVDKYVAYTAGVAPAK